MHMRWMYRLWVLSVWGLLVASLHVAWAEPRFVVGVQNFKEYLPYSQYENGVYTGFSRKLLDLFASTQGYTFEYAAYPVKRLYRVFLERAVDFKYPDNAYWSADLKQGHTIAYSDPVVEYIDGVLVTPQNRGKGTAALNTLGVIHGFTPFAYMKFIKAGELQTSENRNYEGLLRQTMTGRVDGAYMNVAVSRYYVSKYLQDPQAVVFDAELPHTRSFRHLSSIKHPHIITEFNAFLQTHTQAVEALKHEYKVEEGVR